MSNDLASKPSRRLLDPIDRTSEVLFGLIMALSFTCAISAADAGREDVRTMMFGALGCNIAWGLIDAVIFLLSSLTGRARGLATLRALRCASDPQQARGIIADALPTAVASVLSDEDYVKLRDKLGLLKGLPDVPRLGRAEVLAAAGIFLLVFLATFPVVIPFMVIGDAIIALRVSNLVALGMLFAAGYSLGRYAQHRPVRMGLWMMCIGTVLVGITIALGG